MVRHKSRRKHEEAWAPYNFVPLQKASELLQGDLKSHAIYDGHSGFFNVTLTTESPTFIRGMLTAEEKLAGLEAKDKPDFFTIDGKNPTIPGSSLRGMLRNLLEIVSFGKMHFVSDKYLVYRKVFGGGALARDYREMTQDILASKEYNYPSYNMQGGYLKRGKSESGWVIQPAIQHHNDSIALVHKEDVFSVGITENPELRTYQVTVRPPTDGRIMHKGKQGVQLHIAKATGISRDNRDGFEPATLIISSTIGGRVRGRNSNRTWYPAIYQADTSANPIPISQKIWDSWRNDRDLQRGIDNRETGYRNKKDKIIEVENDPVFFILQRGQLRFFGPTMLFRVPYDNSITDMIPDGLQNPATIDYADTLFGYVSDKEFKRNPVAYAGRVSVTSAKVEPKQSDFYHEEIPLKILGSPKPTSYQHYLEQPDGVDTGEFDLFHYNDNTELRGHKLYWRQEISSLDDIKGDGDAKKEKVTTRVKPLRKNVKFTFKVHFDNLTNAELGALAWVLSLDNAPDARHQIGMGKPLGMGVLKLDPELVLVNREERYQQLFNDDGGFFTGEEEISTEDMMSAIGAFKEAVQEVTRTPFDAHPRIKELKTLLRTISKRIDYMSIDDKDYDGHPVLPRPSQVK